MYLKYNDQNKNTMGKGIDLNNIVLSRTSIEEYIKSPHFPESIYKFLTVFYIFLHY